MKGSSAWMWLPPAPPVPLRGVPMFKSSGGCKGIGLRLRHFRLTTYIPFQVGAGWYFSTQGSISVYPSPFFSSCLSFKEPFPRFSLFPPLSVISFRAFRLVVLNFKMQKSITWEFVKNEDSQPPLMDTLRCWCGGHPRFYILKTPPGDSKEEHAWATVREVVG